MSYGSSSSTAEPLDPLFLERLDTFMERSLTDVKGFADREFRPFEETRRLVAEWHARYLFQPTIQDATPQDRAVKVRTVLCDVSRMLESLSKVAGIQSFILAVDPKNNSDPGFLGGTNIGQEFWRSMRSGGDTGVKAFKAHCFRDLESYLPSEQHGDHPLSLPNDIPTPPKLPPARSLKTELYDVVRKTLRSVVCKISCIYWFTGAARAVSGVRNAEMKWTNHERLDVYGVRLIGWPSDIPVANPSSLKVSQNKVILNCVENGTLRFERLFPDAPLPLLESTNDVPPIVDEVPTVQQLKNGGEFSWGSLDSSDPPMSEDILQPTVYQTGENEDTFWPATDDASAMIGDPWTDIDIASLLKNDFDDTSHSRKRPRSELEQD